MRNVAEVAVLQAEGRWDDAATLLATGRRRAASARRHALAALDATLAQQS